MLAHTPAIDVARACLATVRTAFQLRRRCPAAELLVTQPVETAEGWYALHWIARVDRRAWRTVGADERRCLLEDGRARLTALRTPSTGGWTILVALVGSTSDVMLIHLRPTLEDLRHASDTLAQSRFLDFLIPVEAHLGVAETGLFELTAELATEARARGGAVGDEAYRAERDRRITGELTTSHVRRRLYPDVPSSMPYVSFYPMSKRRTPADNWYALTIEERARLMRAHGLIGRRFAKHAQQIVTGAIGLSDWEWGVTIFGRDPLDIKRLVTAMRYDEASARYAEFGNFHTGIVTEPDAWLASLELVAPR